MNPDLVIRRDNDECLALLMKDSGTVLYRANGMHADALLFLTTQTEVLTYASLKEHLLSVYEVESQDLDNDISNMLTIFGQLDILSIA